MKISIPKEAVEHIMAEYHCSQEEASKAYLDATDHANEAFKSVLDERFGSSKETQNSPVPKIFTPKEIKKHLDRYVVGQEDYKRRLAIAASYHFAMIKHLRDHLDDEVVKRFRKKNTITAGPSGSGKTYCVEVLGDLLQVPTLIVDATDYTEAGYVGKNADDMIRELVDLAPGYNREEQAQFISKYGGMICIDDIDKKAKDGAIVGHDISREGFQRSVLKLIERKLVSINNPYSAASQIKEMMDRQRGVRRSKEDDLISTENILFILGGSFERQHDDLGTIVKKRLQNRGHLHDDGSVEIRGFGAEGRRPGKGQLQNYCGKAEADDFIKFGLLPELVGRSPIRTCVNLLSKADLIRIMKETEDSILNQYKLEFQLFDIDVNFTSEAIDYVAEKAENRKTGARALVSVWESILTDFQFELPGRNFSRLEVTRALCERPKDAILKMMEKSPFVDFIEDFKREHGIELVLHEDAQKYVEEYGREKGIQVSEALKKLLSGASALNYMGIQGPFEITAEILKDPHYFGKLFSKWYEDHKSEGLETNET
jgi:endopeptidase Clp ATP-binding regulatory subunit ClpX